MKNIYDDIKEGLLEIDMSGLRIIEVMPKEFWKMILKALEDSKKSFDCDFNDLERHKLDYMIDELNKTLKEGTGIYRFSQMVNK
jgi:hypothetical protein